MCCKFCTKFNECLFVFSLYSIKHSRTTAESNCWISVVSTPGPAPRPFKKVQWRQSSSPLTSSMKKSFSKRSTPELTGLERNELSKFEFLLLPFSKMGLFGYFAWEELGVVLLLQNTESGKNEKIFLFSFLVEESGESNEGGDLRSKYIV